MDNSIRKLFLFTANYYNFVVDNEFFSHSLSVTISNRFDLDAEANIPTWFSTILLFCVSLTSLIIYRFRYKFKIDTSMHTFWLVLGSVYCFLSLDEAARLHEIFDTSLHIKWIYIYAPLAAIFFITCIYFLVIINKNKNLRNWIIGGLVIYAFGGLIGESFDYFFYASPIEIVFEEGLELLGTIMVLKGSLQELIKHFDMICNHSSHT